MQLSFHLAHCYETDDALSVAWKRIMTPASKFWICKRAMNHVGVAMGRKRLVQKRLESGELIAPFGDMTLKCHQHYYVTTLPGRQWPKIDAFIEWLHSLT
jgi:DNA-binding transcriptional LysR family regulator